ncbi:hypothetical protein R6Q59_022134 [Mikania micrantha]|uniref:Late embryogenesis abundant protein LEA-2 subgroup domain-containing protein n=1 Tax=Mikania micrantha TaxID=192012 RepID=A0A5N6MWU3_9ASTR|nr:hypothetical protein E3N88_27128 [Mikania micrantha]
MPKRPVLRPQRRTNPLIWCFATVCVIITTIVIVTGIIVFSGYLAIRPKAPLLYVHAAHLDQAVYSPDGSLAVRLMIAVKAENHNLKAHVRFYNTSFTLSYQGLSIARLVAGPFDVQKNTSQELRYVVESSSIPLGPVQQEMTEQALWKTKMMPFVLKGYSRTRRQVGPLGPLKFRLHVNCHMWLPTNHTVVFPHCNNKSH